MGINISEGFPELDYEEHIGVFCVEKEGKATARAKAELGNSMLRSDL